MNIFYLDTNSHTAAIWHTDKHVIKMILEVAQMLSTNYRFFLDELPDERFYKSTHVNHPCTKWARESFDNMLWLANHGNYLCEEYTERYGKKHKTTPIMMSLYIHLRLLEPHIPRIGLTPPAQAMPEEYRRRDAVQAYRLYYKYGKKHLHSWKKNKPHWID